jgi:hypothetical protein
MLSFLKFAVSSYNPRLFISDRCSDTPYDEYFTTDHTINGKYFKSKSENKYYQLIYKKDYFNYTRTECDDYYRKSALIEQMTNCKFDKDKHIIVQLQMRDDCNYFIENNNDIKCCEKNQDIILLTYVKSIDDFYDKAPPFIPLPNDHPIDSPEYSDNKYRSSSK